MRLCVAATPKVAIPTLDYLLLSNHELISVITQPDRPSGRGQKSRESEVSKWAAQNNITCLKPQGEQETLAALIDADLLLTIGYGVILPTSVISLPTHGSINLHFSLLPLYRGAAPAQTRARTIPPAASAPVRYLCPGRSSRSTWNKNR